VGSNLGAIFTSAHNPGNAYSHCTDSVELILESFSNFCGQIHFGVKSDESNGCFAWKPIRVFVHTSRIIR
jgi:hypothetical protein